MTRRSIKYGRTSCGPLDLAITSEPEFSEALMAAINDLSVTSARLKRAPTFESDPTSRRRVPTTGSDPLRSRPRPSPEHHPPRGPTMPVTRRALPPGASDHVSLLRGQRSGSSHAINGRGICNGNPPVVESDGRPADPVSEDVNTHLSRTYNDDSHVDTIDDPSPLQRRSTTNSDHNPSPRRSSDSGWAHKTGTDYLELLEKQDDTKYSINPCSKTPAIVAAELGFFNDIPKVDPDRVSMMERDSAGRTVLHHAVIAYKKKLMNGTGSSQSQASEELRSTMYRLIEWLAQGQRQNGQRQNLFDILDGEDESALDLCLECPDRNLPVLLITLGKADATRFLELIKSADPRVYGHVYKYLQARQNTTTS